MTLSLEAIQLLPKVLLHDHLDGGLRPQTILEIADEIGWTPHLPSTDLTELAGWFRKGAETKDLLQYLATFEHTLAAMQLPEHLERVAYEAAIDLANDGVVYAEVRFAPELHQSKGLALEAIVEAVQQGFHRGMADANTTGRSIVVNTIICAMRTETRSFEIARLAVRLRERDDRIVGFDIAGAETGWPPSLHCDALQHAVRNQLHVTVHASEPPDIELIEDALNQGAERIGHGVRLTADISDLGSLEMGRVARAVLERQIPLELAPTCNVQIGAVPELAAHPIGPFLRAGFRVTVNTDNRLMSDVTVSSEVFAVMNTFALSNSEVAQLALNGIDSSFSSWSDRKRIRAHILQAYESAE